MHENSEELFHKVYQSPRYLELHWNRIRKVVDRINLVKKQENLSDHQCASRSCGSNPQQQHRLQNTWHTSFYRPTTGHESQRNGQTVDSAVRESPAQGSFPAGFETDRTEKCVQREVEGVYHRQGQHRDLRSLRNLFQDAMPRLCSLLAQIGIVYCSCGRSLIPSKRTKQLDKTNYDAFSIPSYVIKKGLKHGA